jgi:deoxyxylulose-5-phosphate synthase
VARFVHAPNRDKKLSVSLCVFVRRLHYVFNTPDDLLIWDVNQAYGHKILTGRRDNFHTNRQLGGISVSQKK